MIRAGGIRGWGGVLSLSPFNPTDGSSSPFDSKKVECRRWDDKGCSWRVLLWEQGVRNDIIAEELR